MAARRGDRIRRACLLGLSLLGTSSVQAQLSPWEQLRDNLVVVLDASGSMWGPLPGAGTHKMAAAKRALREVLSRVPRSSQIGLLVFSGSSKGGTGWVYPLGPKRWEPLREAIESPVPDGKTPLAKAMKEGADRLLQERTRQLGYGSFRLVVVTDGIADHPDLVERYARDILSRGIRLDVIGVDLKEGHTLERLSSSYRHADDFASLQAAVRAVMGEVSSDGRHENGYGRSDFDLLAPLGPDLASAMIQGLSQHTDLPIRGLAPR